MFVVVHDNCTGTCEIALTSSRMSSRTRPLLNGQGVVFVLVNICLITVCIRTQAMWEYWF